jgi:hypothetical protein
MVYRKKEKKEEPSKEDIKSIDEELKVDSKPKMVYKKKEKPS